MNNRRNPPVIKCRNTANSSLHALTLSWIDNGMEGRIHIGVIIARPPYFVTKIPGRCDVCHKKSQDYKEDAGARAELIED